MKKLIITRGLPGSGKSTTLSKSGLKDFTISTDTLRMLYSSPVMFSDGRLSVNQDINNVIWPVLFDLVEQRLKDGSTTVIDAVHPSLSDFKKYLELAHKYDYSVACLDFTQVPKEYSEWNNEGRAEYAVVPEEAINRFRKLIDQSPSLPDNITNIVVKADLSHYDEINKWLSPEIKDLSHYKEVVHIGDIQGCLEPLLKALPNGIEEDKFYIFVGDFCDRGEQNAEVIKYLNNNVIGKPNVQTLIGNHEYHLFREIKNEAHVSNEFMNFTKKQFNAHGIGHKDIQKVLSGIKEVFFYKYKDKNVMVSHGGLPTIPKKPWMIPSKQYENGVGYYEQDVDTTFNEKAPEKWYQVHGHRNISQHPIVYDRSINLEGRVEFGGNLRIANLDDNGFHGLEYRNTIVREWRKRLKRKNEIIPEWMKGEDDNGRFVPTDILKALRDHSGVKEKQSEKYPFISSMSFTKDVFYSKSWDDIVNKARGLFIDIETNEIVARSYDKFFTINENEEMELDTFSKKITYPIEGRLKENGYLGITGYISKTDELFLSSKSSPTGEFADNFQEIFNNTLTKGQQEQMKHMMRDLECSFIFEVIDPVKDPHMVEYDKPKIVLLDVVRRSMDYEKLPYEDVVKVAEKFGLEYAPRLLTLPNEKALKGWFNKASKDMSKEFEGYVWQDAKGEMFKTKNPFYSFWKLMRGTKDAILREKEFLASPVPQNELSLLNRRFDKLKNDEESQKIIDKYISKDDITYNDINQLKKEINSCQNVEHSVLKAIKDSIKEKKPVSRQSMRSFLETRDLDFVADEADNFKSWCFEQPIDTLKHDIITIRKEYEAIPAFTLKNENLKTNIPTIH